MVTEYSRLLFNDSGNVLLTFGAIEVAPISFYTPTWAERLTFLVWIRWGSGMKLWLVEGRGPEAGKSAYFLSESQVLISVGSALPQRTHH